MCDTLGVNLKNVTLSEKSQHKKPHSLRFQSRKWQIGSFIQTGNSGGHQGRERRAGGGRAGRGRLLMGALVLGRGWWAWSKRQ